MLNERSNCGFRQSGAWTSRPSPDGPSADLAEPPLRVAVVGKARTPLLDAADARVVARELGDPLVEEADVLFFPRCENMDFAERAWSVPKRLWRRARCGQTTVVLDASNEGHTWWSDHSQLMHDVLARRAVDPAFAVHLTQDRLYRTDYLAWCARKGLTPMKIVVFDAFIGRSLQTLRADGEQIFETRHGAFLHRPARRSRRFLSLNHAPRPNRVAFLMRLIRDRLWDRGWISFGGFQPDPSSKLSKTRVIESLSSLPGFREDIGALLPMADQLDAMGPVLFGLKPGHEDALQRKQALKADDLPQYAESWFTVVTETEMSAQLHRITEKPLKPLLNLHPFLVLGNPGSLKLLRQYGFETYSEILDERYDEEPDPRRRFDMVYDQVVRLCALDEAEMARMTRKASEVLAFNARWGLTELPKRFAETVVGEVIGQLAPARRTSDLALALAPAAGEA